MSVLRPSWTPGQVTCVASPQGKFSHTTNKSKKETFSLPQPLETWFGTAHVYFAIESLISHLDLADFSVC